MSPQPNQTLPNTFGLSCKVSALQQPSTIEALQNDLVGARESSLPTLIIGAGSNILFVDQSLEACVIQPALTSLRIEQQESDVALVSAGAGINWHQFVLTTLQRGWQGLENLALIPGHVGAAPIQNIGAYGVEVSDLIASVEAISIANGEQKAFLPNQLQFAYRDSFFKREGKNRYAITSVNFRLHRNYPLNVSYDALATELAVVDAKTMTAMDVANAVTRVRQSKLPDPILLGNAGSFFKNPVVPFAVLERLQANFAQVPHYPQHDGQIKLAAGWLIEKAGMKGFRRGAAGTHDKQALVIVNHGGATGAHIVDVAREVRDTVWQKFEVKLEPEVRILDRFAEEVSL